jgi:hypothetical protein
MEVGQSPNRSFRVKEKKKRERPTYIAKGYLRILLDVLLLPVLYDPRQTESKLYHYKQHGKNKFA